MNQAKKLELRDAGKTWASLTLHTDGRISLDHNLTEYEVKGCPSLQLYDSQGQQVRIELRVMECFFLGPTVGLLPLD